MKRSFLHPEWLDGLFRTISFDQKPPLLDRLDADDDVTESGDPRQRPGPWAMLWPLVRPYRYWLLFSIGLSMLHGLSLSFQNLMGKYLIDDVIGQQLHSDNISGAVASLAMLLVFFLLASIVGRMLAWHLSYRIFTRTREKLFFSLRSSFFRKINSLCLRFQNRSSSGELFSYLFGTPLNDLLNFFQNLMMNVINSIATILITFFWLFTWDVPMTIVLFFSVGTSFGVTCWARKGIKGISRAFQEVQAEVSGSIEDILRGVRDVKMYAMENRINDDFDRQLDQIQRMSYYNDVKLHVYHMLQESTGYMACYLRKPTFG